MCMCVLLRNRRTGSIYRIHTEAALFQEIMAVERSPRELYDNGSLKGKINHMPSNIMKYVLLNSGPQVPEIKPDTEMLPVTSTGLKWVRWVGREVCATKGSIIRSSIYI